MKKNNDDWPSCECMFPERMHVAGAFVVCESGTGMVTSFVTTNLPEVLLRERLAGEMAKVDGIEHKPDPLRLFGGAGFAIRWTKGTSRAEALAILRRLL